VVGMSVAAELVAVTQLAINTIDDLQRKATKRLVTAMVGMTGGRETTEEQTHGNSTSRRGDRIH
jgi:hypothetical protein